MQVSWPRGLFGTSRSANNGHSASYVPGVAVMWYSKVLTQLRDHRILTVYIYRITKKQEHSCSIRHGRHSAGVPFGPSAAVLPITPAALCDGQLSPLLHDRTRRILRTLFPLAAAAVRISTMQLSLRFGIVTSGDAEICWFN